VRPPSSLPTTGDVAGAVARFFHGGAGPSHSVISRVLTESGFFDDYEARTDVQGPNKESRVLRAFTASRAEPARARKLVDGLLGSLRLAGLVGADVDGEDVDRLRRALGSAGWYLTDDGYLRPSPVSTSTPAAGRHSMSSSNGCVGRLPILGCSSARRKTFLRLSPSSSSRSWGTRRRRRWTLARCGT